MCISDWSSDVCSSDLPQKIKRHRLRRSRSRMPREEFNARGGDEAAELARLGAAATGLPPSTAQLVQLLIDGAAKYAPLLEAIAPARAPLHVEYYLSQPDRTRNPQRLRSGQDMSVRVQPVGRHINQKHKHN